MATSMFICNWVQKYTNRGVRCETCPSNLKQFSRCKGTRENQRALLSTESWSNPSGNVTKKVIKKKQVCFKVYALLGDRAVGKTLEKVRNHDNCDDSSLLVADITRDILQSVLSNCCAVSKASGTREKSKSPKSSTADETTTENFAETPYTTMSDWHGYALHYCQTYSYSRQKNYISLRMRCLTYIEPWTGKAALAELRSNKKTLEMNMKLSHNRENGLLVETDGVKRVLNL